MVGNIYQLWTSILLAVVVTGCCGEMAIRYETKDKKWEEGYLGNRFYTQDPIYLSCHVGLNGNVSVAVGDLNRRVISKHLPDTVATKYPIVHSKMEVMRDSSGIWEQANEWQSGDLYRHIRYYEFYTFDTTRDIQIKLDLTFRRPDSSTERVQQELYFLNLRECEWEEYPVVEYYKPKRFLGIF